MKTGEQSVPYGKVEKVAIAYEEARRMLGFPTYQAVNWMNNPEAHDNWVHYERCAALMIASNCEDAVEWMRAQFRGATREVYPWPNHLYSDSAVKKFLDAEDGETVSGRVDVQQQWMAQYKHLFPERTDTEIVMNPLWAFDSWFRVLYAESVPSPMAEKAADELRGSSALRAAITEAGIDLSALQQKIKANLR